MNFFLNHSLGIPVLAYHEVHQETERDKQKRTMGASCSIENFIFNEQLSCINKLDIETLSFDDIFFPLKNENPIEIKNKIIITFDDGHVGNYLYAFPLLSEYNFKATFFVTINNIGLNKMVNWQQLYEMARSGMSIQSHGVTHEPFETLNHNALEDELVRSKYTIEEKIGFEVTSMSLPHGSIHPRVIEKAARIGYKFICTSSIDYWYPFHSTGTQLVSRIPVADFLPIETFSKILTKKNFVLIHRWKTIKNVKMFIRKIIGINNYRRLYRIVNRIY